MSDFEKFGNQHPYLPSGWGPQARADIPRNSPMLPDVNPAAGLLARLIARFGEQAVMGGGAGINGQDGLNGTGGQDGANGANGANGSNGLNGLDGRVSSIEQRLNNASGEGTATCNGDGTIDIEITITI